MTKRVGLISYPMLFQKQGGLQIQVKETLDALQQLGVQVELFDVLNSKLEDFDIIHIFSANHGNHNIVHAAKEKGCKVVMSPLAEEKWNKKYAHRSKFLEKFTRKLSGYLNYSFFSMVNSAFNECDHLVALGEGEKLALQSAFDVPVEKISIVKNGIPARFFSANSEYFHQKIKIDGDFVLNVASVYPLKNQLLLAQILKQHLPKMKLVLIGPVSGSNQTYLRQILDVGNTVYLGAFEYNSPMLPSAYAAASVFVLPSSQEVYPLSALEALATGTPAIVTKVSSMKFNSDNNAFSLVDPCDERAIAAVIAATVKNKPNAISCKKLVNGLSWQQVAKQLNEIYNSL
tara:strand:+ start:609 stop:1643 length:1035 start_codon:yes stop_codon:yes gene_type:complete